MKLIDKLIKRKTFTQKREILNRIPKGEYCYTPLSYDSKTGIFKVKSCPYWKSIGKGRAKCTLYKIKDKYPQDLTLLWDMVKCCGLKR